MSFNQKGFGIIEGFIAIVAVIVLGAVGYYIYSQNRDDNTDAGYSQTTQETESAKQTPKASAVPEGWVEFSDDEIGVKLFHPSEWQTLRCSAKPDMAYLGSDPRNIGKFAGSDSSILCGGGTDFPPQVAIAFKHADDSGNIYRTEHSGEQVIIDGTAATRSRQVSDGSGLRPKGFVKVMYQVKIEDKLLTIVYNQWPPGSSYDYDLNPKNEEVFETMITKTLDIKD